MPIKVLLVCTGNTCRSSMGEALLRRLAESRRRAGAETGAGDGSAAGQAAGAPAVEVEVRSAGTGARDGDPASDHAIDVMRERGIDLRSHRTRRLTQDLIDWADIILTMTTGQKLYVTTTFRGAHAKTFTLGEYAAGAPAGAGDAGMGDGEAARGGAVDIEDPFGRPVEAYRRSAEQIEAALAAAWERIVRDFGRGEAGTGE